MNSAYLKIFMRFFLLTVFIFAVSGCGSSSSTVNNETGSIAAKLIWSSSESKTEAKTLYAAPAGVTTIKVFVYDANMISLITPKDFTVTPGVDGSGTIDGIPAGSGYTVKAWGMDIGGNLRYQASTTPVTIVAGQTTPVTIPLYPVTTPSKTGGTYNAGFGVTLTSGESATIYYTTNGTDPTTGSASGVGSVTNIQINPGPPVILKYFAGFQGLFESIKSQIYSIVPLTTASPAGGSYSVPQSITLTTSEPATIYYTTNGDTPTTSSASGPSPISNIFVAVNSVLKFFAIDNGGTQESIKSESYHNP